MRKVTEKSKICSTELTEYGDIIYIEKVPGNTGCSVV